MSESKVDRGHSREEYSDWLQSPITKDVIEMLIQLRDTHLIYTMGSTTSEAMAKLVGEASGLNIAVDFIGDLGTPTEEEEEEEAKRRKEETEGANSN